MEDLVKSNSGENSEEPEIDDDDESAEEPKTPAPARRTRVETHRVRPSFLRALAWVLAVIVIALLLVLLARWLYHATHNSNNSNPPSTSQNSSASSSNKKASGNRPAGGSSAQSNSNYQITNTGPGDVTAIFVGATLIAAGLHFIISLRRSSKSDA